MVLGKRLEAREPIEARQLHVEQDHVGVDALQERQQLAPVGDLADELHVLVLLEDELDRVAHQRVILDEHHLDDPHEPHPL